jgi:hypothetical protein
MGLFKKEKEDVCLIALGSAVACTALYNLKILHTFNSKDKPGARQPQHKTH